MSLIIDIEKKLGNFCLNVNIQSDSGVLGLLGASGCGKSMTLKCIAGIVKPDRGRIILGGVTLFNSERGVNLPPQKRKIGFLFQNYALFPNMTVKQNILCGLNRERDRKIKESTVNDIVHMMHLDGLEKHKPSQLSGGQQQRVALARIMVTKPDLIMLDEPFSALDSHLRNQMQVQMQHVLNEFGKDAIIVTHSRNEAYKLCNTIALVDSGCVVVHKPTKDLFADPESRVAARLTGCKNIVEASKSGPYEVNVPSWGIRLKTALPIRDDLCAIAIRAHYFKESITENRHKIVFTDKLEEPFEYILQFCYLSQEKSSDDIWWRVSKELLGENLPEELGIDPVDVLPLYE